jgi:hypothetical protein
MIDKRVFALCSVILFATLAMGILMSGPGFSRGMIVLALALGGTGQYIAQDDRFDALRGAAILNFIAMLLMGAGASYYAMEAIFS